MNQSNLCLRFSFLLLTCLILFLSSCVPSPEPPEPQQPEPLTVEEEIDNRFTFRPNRPFNAIYQCGRLNSQLLWFFVFKDDGSMQVLFTTDTHEDFVFDGTYSYDNNQLRLRMPAGPTMPFPQGLDEGSTAIMPQFDLIAAFSTPEMICICEGHDLNTQAPPKVQANYDCPEINVQASTYEDNAIEFVHREMPFDLAVPGSIFRQQDTYINGLSNPNIRRGFGIYRQDGNRFFASFRIAQDFADFARNELPVAFNPGVPFNDHNLISGSILNGGQEIIVDQLDPNAGACGLR